MSRKKLEISEDYLTQEPYKSIINVLEIAPSFRKKFKRGLKPRQLMHIIVEGYSVNDTTRRVLDNFRKLLTEDEKIKGRVKLDQLIAGKYPHQGFNKYLNKLQLGGWIERKKGRIVLSSKRRFEPLRFWYGDFIRNCPITKIVNYDNSTIFHPHLSFTTQEKNEIKGVLDGFYGSVGYLFSKIGLRQAGDEWSKFISKIEVSPATKLYFWFKLIYVHYLASLRPDMIVDGYGYFRKGEVLPIGMEAFMELKKTDFERRILSKKIRDWQPKFLQLLEGAVKKRYSDVYKDEQKDYAEEFKKLCNKTLMTRVKAEYFTVIIRPEFLSYFYLKDVEEIGKEKSKAIFAATILNASNVKVESHETPIKKCNIANFFDGFDAEITALGYEDKKEFCDDLMPLANAFEVPVLKPSAS